jgi:proteic killer suppression protein
MVIDSGAVVTIWISAMMEVEFADDALDQLEIDPRATGGFPPAVVKGYRKAMQAIRSAADERDLYALRGLRFEKLKGDRQGQHSLRCNGQFRLIIELHGKGETKKVRVKEIVDYHD